MNVSWDKVYSPVKLKLKKHVRMTMQQTATNEESLNPTDKAAVCSLHVH